MINEYLTEQSLFDFCQERFEHDVYRNMAVPGSGFKSDVIIPALKLTVEFDGYRHYQQSSVILRDIERDDILASRGYRVIRIPYFVQLDEWAIHHLFHEFGIKTHAFNDYPHGFIDKKALLPADFCEMGVDKFMEDLMRFAGIQKPIVESMEKHVIAFKDQVLRAWPPSLVRLRGAIVDSGRGYYGIFPDRYRRLRRESD